jgi:hypothetical protein
VNHAAFVRGLERVGDSARDVARPVDRQWTPCDAAREILAFDRLELEELDAVDFLAAVALREVRVIQRR